MDELLKQLSTLEITKDSILVVPENTTREQVVELRKSIVHNYGYHCAIVPFKTNILEPTENSLFVMRDIPREERELTYKRLGNALGREFVVLPEGTAAIEHTEGQIIIIKTNVNTAIVDLSEIRKLTEGALQEQFGGDHLVFAIDASLDMSEMSKDLLVSVRDQANEILEKMEG